MKRFLSGSKLTLAVILAVPFLLLGLLSVAVFIFCLAVLQVIALVFG